MNVAYSRSPLPSRAVRWVGPPRWLVVATGLIAVCCLAMAVAETNLWMHYLIDDGEYVSLVGLAFVSIAGLHLHRSRRLLASLPLIVPWLLFPVITQGDQLIDHLSITWMRVITHVLLAAIFATPVAVAVLAVVSWARARGRPSEVWLTAVPGLRLVVDGRVREGASLLAVTLLVLEIGIAARALGLLMIGTLIVLVLAVLVVGTAVPSTVTQGIAARWRRLGERVALVLLLVGVATSMALFIGFKHRPGAYQGSPSYYMDPARRGEGFRFDEVARGTLPVTVPADPEGVRAALAGYGRALQQLVVGYHVLDRNYTYDFHNRLFLRRSPVLSNYRAVGLTHVHEAHDILLATDASALAVRAGLRDGDPLGALLDDVRGYALFNLDRAPLLERMSAGFEQTEAGLQHAAHLYEGEGKVVTARLADLLEKHAVVLAAPTAAPVTDEFTRLSRELVDMYAARIVGF